MWASSLVASLHYVALAMGSGSVFMRGRFFKNLSENSTSLPDLKKLLVTDTIWGLAALLWLLTGIARAFGGLEKGSAFYLQNPLFYLKMGLFVVVLLLELAPMIALIKIRIRLKNKQSIGFSAQDFRRYRKLNHWEATLVLLMIFVASAMARGLWPPN